MTAALRAPEATLDHLVVMAGDLDDGIAWVQEQIGVRVPLGGRHDRMATHNAVAAFAAPTDSYLEIIAPDPRGATPERARWFGFDTPGLLEGLRRDGPRLAHWLVRTPDLECTLAAAGPQHGEAIDMSRGDLSWRIAVRTDGGLLAGGLVPGLLQWPPGPHPAKRMEQLGFDLSRLTLTTDDVEGLQHRLAALAVDDDGGRIEIVAGPVPRLTATLTRNGKEYVLG